MDSRLRERAVEVTLAAPAKLNLALHVVGRRADGYHLIESLVAFAQPADGDRLTVVFDAPGAGVADRSDPRLTVDGPFAFDIPERADNIALRAARVTGGIAAVRLWKGLPVASGIGGGSADAAAVLRVAARHRGLAADAYAEDALTLGADVPVCLASRSALMAGIGERLTPALLPRVPVLLVNPGIPVATAAVFARLARRDNSPLPPLPDLEHAEALAGWLGGTRNDLEPAAVGLAPQIAEVLYAVRGTNCLIARMSGSGGTVFGLYADAGSRDAAARRLARPGWWVRGATLGDGD